MIRPLTLAALVFLVATTSASASEDTGYPTPSEVASEQAEDFTDSGVGCVDDCLEPFTDPATVPDQYKLEREDHESNN